MSALLEQFSLGGDNAQSSTIVIKDSIDIAGYRTTGASRALANVAPARRHAEVVQRLLDRGWKIVGKANMHELAFGMTGINEYTGTPVNPQDATRIPGGSSSGSAVAVGARMADAALGTDTGGSIRGPAACCGVIGLKPTFGRVSRVGAAPAQSTLDCVGPLAREMRVIIAAMSAISPAFDPGIAEGGAGVARIGIVQAEARPDILKAVEMAVRKADFASAYVDLPGLADAFSAGLSIINRETSAAFGPLVETGHLQPDLEARLRAAAKTSDLDVENAERVRTRFTQAVNYALATVDVLIMPTMPDFPITLEQARNGTSVIAMSSLIRPFNLSGHPALSLPVPVSGTTLKAGLQIVGRHGEDEWVCAVASRIEAALSV
ncbi:amidase [Paraburkholderia bannensis]|uniref:Amidase n=1 Tax=Paraburkholderia bannensis TaxID=765414 RepID=A0A7W9WRN3_9BURK|nr:MULTISPECIES: amidase [Paraburkholderia]MBB3258367.1 amidase [Paraburkholderia sp. WP4_3_2]MBB6103380.1 amidase [Paraburkholderia bannensis]